MNGVPGHCPPVPVAIAPGPANQPPECIRVGPLGPVTAGASAELARCRRILVVKLDHVGDWVLCTPFLENLRRNAPSAAIDVLVLPPVYDLACACPHVDRAIALVAKRGTAFEISARRWTDAASFERDYTGAAYDLAVVPRWDADFDGAARIAGASRARLVVGFSEHCTRRKRVINRGADCCYTHVIDDRRAVHEVEHNLALIEVMRGQVATRHTSLHVSGADERTARSWLSAKFGRRPGRAIALAPFASEPKRELPVRACASLVERLALPPDCAFVVLGGPGDRARGARLAALLRPRAVSAAAWLTIRETAALIGCCDALVGVDSAPAHIAAALGTPVAVLSCHPAAGSAAHANSPQRFAPWSGARAAEVLVLQPAVAAPPCRDCCVACGPHCILGIDADALERLAVFLARAIARGAPARFSAAKR